MIVMTFTTWKPGQHAQPAAGDVTCFVGGFCLDVVQCIPQETAPGRSGKGRIRARLISYADNTGGSGSARRLQPAESLGERAGGGGDRTDMR